MKVIEAMIVAAMTATVGFLMIYLITDCKPIGEKENMNTAYLFPETDFYPFTVLPIDSMLYI